VELITLWSRDYSFMKSMFSKMERRFIASDQSVPSHRLSC
jgi:hypothetical protein